MRPIFDSKDIQRLVDAVIRHQKSPVDMERALQLALREHTLVAATLPLVLQRLSASKQWICALAVLRSSTVGNARLLRDDNIWSIAEKGAPCDVSKEATRNVLKSVFSRSTIVARGATASSGRPPKQ